MSYSFSQWHQKKCSDKWSVQECLTSLPSCLNSSNSSTGGSPWLKPVIILKFPAGVSGWINQLYLWAACGEPFLFIIKLSSNSCWPELEPYLSVPTCWQWKANSHRKLCVLRDSPACCCPSSESHLLSECGPLGQLHGFYNGNLINWKFKSSSLLTAQKLLLMAAVTWSVLHSVSSCYPGAE